MPAILLPAAVGLGAVGQTPARAREWYGPRVVSEN
jgi:hypothetical protein